jgi:hypothetical protein
MAERGWFSSCAMVDAISPTVTSRAVVASRSSCWRASSRARFRSVMSRTDPIQPVCRPSASMRGAS